MERLVEPQAAPSEDAVLPAEDEVEVGEEAGLAFEAMAPAGVGDEVPELEASTASGPLAIGEAAVPVPLVAAASSVQLQQLSSRLQLRPRGDGGLIIEAPPEAAELLATLFEGLAGALRADRRASS